MSNAARRDFAAIAAICSPPGKGALALIRVSGPGALKIVRKIAGFLPARLESRRAYMGILKSRGEELDQAVLTFFSEGKSFTGEETVEITCHGGLAAAEVLKSLLAAGARMAERGEFSLQAFLNGKIDLLQAEGVFQLIESETIAARRQALAQLKGELSKKLAAAEKKWLLLLSQIEAGIDFSLEGLSLMEPEEITSRIQELKAWAERSLSRFRPFEKLQKGLLAGIFGPVNSGKSSLFNALLGEEKAIVSDEEGATRDLVEGVLPSPRGLPLSLRDTAGFRPPQAPAAGGPEAAGRQKALALWKACDLQILVLDGSELFASGSPAALPEKWRGFLRSAGGGEKASPPRVWVFTKKDLCPPRAGRGKLLQALAAAGLDSPAKDDLFFASSKTGEGISRLRERLLLFGRDDEGGESFAGGLRHYKCFLEMRDSLLRAERIARGGGERDLMAAELREGLLALQSLLGRHAGPDILDSVFSQFCIGK